ncbi:MAG TPA: glycoside hydrolase family 43 protein [Anaerohalosphaeraceae bacterium]|nr:glycoside hydrolase family 43 protein [Anaerohalosphaeraceae bacterium]HOL87986.1 glycoside hydrolase family 43 protein [Anaerohalosphaeraceae bacterium]HPP55485.1 glycoside hydrolase family 43 protein [Anaerohalosphaeraceae bacterium]
MRKGCFTLAVCLLWNAAAAQMPDPPGQIKPGQTPVYEAYLFAHMMEGDYGRLYYSVSPDGLHWTLLNGGRRVFEEYRGHPDICRGHDGRYYLVGNRRDEDLVIHVWVSEDLLHWSKYSQYEPNLRSIPDYPKALMRVGAPKLFYDEPSAQYILTWHTTHDLGPTDLPEPYWAGQRTIYALSKDLKTFSSPPKKLFGWDMATIDVIIRRAGEFYYAVIKDERYPTLDWPTGKTIRICRSRHLLGPYSKPGPPVSPNFREAPMLIPSPDGKIWYLYYEQYPGISYGLSIAEKLEGPWYQAYGNSPVKDWNKYEVPAKARHGCMLPISRREYETLVSALK